MAALKSPSQKLGKLRGAVVPDLEITVHRLEDGPVQSKPSLSTRFIVLVVAISIAVCAGVAVGIAFRLGLGLGAKDSSSENPSFLSFLARLKPTNFTIYIVQAQVQTKEEAAQQADKLINTLQADNTTSFQLFSTWMKLQKKEYTSDAAAIQAHANFFDKLQTIIDINADPTQASWAGLNTYSDMSWEEFKSTVLMSLPQRDDTADRVRAQMAAAASTPAAGANKRKLLQSALPARIDWREQGKTTPVRYQGACGACWAFTATSAIESAALIAYGSLTNTSIPALSQQQLVSCVNANSGFDGAGCNGGWADYAFDYVAKYHQVYASTYPYTATAGTCQAQLTAAPSDPQTRSVRLAPVATYGTHYQGQKRVPSGSKLALMQAVGQGPVVFYFNAQSTWSMLRSTSVYRPTTTDCDPWTTNHAMLLVGYDTTGPDPYWIVQNSWGTSWGDKGYAKLYMEEDGPGPCGAYLYAYQPSLQFSSVPSEWITDPPPTPSPPTSPTSPASPSIPASPSTPPPARPPPPATPPPLSPSPSVPPSPPPPPPPPTPHTPPSSSPSTPPPPSSPPSSAATSSPPASQPPSPPPPSSSAPSPPPPSPLSADSSPAMLPPPAPSPQPPPSPPPPSTPHKDSDDEDDHKRSQSTGESPSPSTDPLASEPSPPPQQRTSRPPPRRSSTSRRPPPARSPYPRSAPSPSDRDDD